MSPHIHTCVSIYVYKYIHGKMRSWKKTPDKPRLDSEKRKNLKIMLLPKSIKLQVGLILNTWAKSSPLDHETLEDRKPAKQQQRSWGPWQLAASWARDFCTWWGVCCPTKGPGERSHRSREGANSQPTRAVLECGIASPVPAIATSQQLRGHIQKCVEGTRAAGWAQKMWSSWAKK